MVTIEEQIEGLNQLRSLVETSADFIRNRMKKVEDMLNELESMSLPREIADKYRYHYLEYDKETIDILVDTMCKEHLEYIDRKIMQLSGAPTIN